MLIGFAILALVGAWLVIQPLGGIGGFTRNYNPSVTGNCTTLTDANGGTYTLSQAELQGGNCLVFAAGGLGQEVVVLTFPATSTLASIIPNAGDYRTWLYDATALVAATTTTVAAGTGMTLLEPNDGDAHDVIIAGGQYARLECWRQPSTDLTCTVTEMTDAD